MRLKLLALSLIFCSVAHASNDQLPISITLNATKSEDGASYSQVSVATISGAIGVVFFIGRLPMDQLIVRITGVQYSTANGTQFVQLDLDVFDATEARILSSAKTALSAPGGVSRGSKIYLPFPDVTDASTKYSGSIEATLN